MTSRSTPRGVTGSTPKDPFSSKITQFQDNGNYSTNTFTNTHGESGVKYVLKSHINPIHVNTHMYLSMYITHVKKNPYQLWDASRGTRMATHSYPAAGKGGTTVHAHCIRVWENNTYI
jgi:hypothetical protein